MMDKKTITKVLHVFRRKITFVVVFFLTVNIVFAFSSELGKKEDEVPKSLEKDTIGITNTSKVEIFVAKGTTIINFDSIKGNLRITYEKTLKSTKKNGIAKKSFQADAKEIIQVYKKIPAKELKVKISKSIPHSLLTLSLYKGNSFVIPTSQTQIKAVVCYNNNYKSILSIISQNATQNFGFANTFVIKYHSGYFFSRPPPSIS